MIYVCMYVCTYIRMFVGRTPLHHAAMEGLLEYCEKLVELGTGDQKTSASVIQDEVLRY